MRNAIRTRTVKIGIEWLEHGTEKKSETARCQTRTEKGGKVARRMVLIRLLGDRDLFRCARGRGAGFM